MEENIPQLNELVNPNKWDDKNWMKVHMELESYSIDKHCFSKEKEFAYRKGWEWTQTLFGLHVLGAMTPNARALGVGAGREPVLFYLADRIESVTGIDLYGNRQTVQEEVTMTTTSQGVTFGNNVFSDRANWQPFGNTQSGDTGFWGSSTSFILVGIMGIIILISIIKFDKIKKLPETIKTMKRKKR